MRPGALLLLALAVPSALGQSATEEPVPEPADTQAAAPLDEEAIARAVEAYLEANRPSQPAKDWEGVLDHLTVYGDFRLRLEATGTKGDLTNDRARVRGRLGANYLLGDDFVVGARLVTGDPEDPRSSHWTLGQGFDEISFELDRLFLAWHPGAAPGFRLIVGAFDLPIVRNPVYGELVWDADVQPQGGATGYERELGGAFESAGVTLCGLTYDARTTDPDVTILATQAFARFRAGNELRGTLALGYYGYSGLVDGDVSAGLPLDYDLLNPMAELTLSSLGPPLVLSAETQHNLASSGSASRGWAAGFALGRAARRGDWRGWYQYQEVGADAVFAALAQDDFVTDHNFRGHAFGVNHQFTDKIGLQFWMLISTPLVAAPPDDVTSYRVRLDLNVKL